MFFVITNFDFLFRVKPKPIDICKVSSKRARNGEGICNKVEILLKDPSKWCSIDNREQYTFLGFFHDTTKLLYVNDVTTMKQSTSSNLEFLWKDIHLSKGSSFPKKTITIGDKKYWISRSPCNGVKVMYKFISDVKNCSN